MSEHLLIGLAAVLVLGIGAQWLAWRLDLPSILLLLLAGIVAGPVTGFLDPDALLGDVLLPTVSVSVAIILFEGGLSLRISDLRSIGVEVRNLLTIGVGVTWALTSVGSHLLLGLDLPIAILLGAVLVVSGPTVVIPLLRTVHPTAKVGSILRWECVVIDPIGALLAVLVFEAIVASGFAEISSLALGGVVRTVLIGGGFGLIGALAMVFLLSRFWIPDHLHETVTLMVVVLAFTASNVFQAESGLLSTTVMGIVLANQKITPVQNIVDFKENLRVLLISVLFILLSARLDPGDFAAIGPEGWLFLGALVLIVRPVSVALSTIGSDLDRTERAFLAWMAPRGIVAAAVSSLFALRLADAGVPQAELLLPYSFLVIIGTVALYSLTARPLGRRIGVARSHPRGVLILGTDRVARAIGLALQEEGYPVLLVSRNWSGIRAARAEGLPTHFGGLLSEHRLERIEVDGKLDDMGRFLALSPNDEANALTALHLMERFGRKETYQLSPPEDNGHTPSDLPPQSLRGRLLFDAGVTYARLRDRLRAGAVIKKHSITEEFGYDALRQIYGANAVPLFRIRSDGELQVITAGSLPEPAVGDALLSLVDAGRGENGESNPEPIVGPGSEPDWPEAPSFTV